MLEEYLTDEEKREIKEKFLGFIKNKEYKKALKYYEKVNNHAKAYLNRKYHWELLNTKSTIRHNKTE